MDVVQCRLTIAADGHEASASRILFRRDDRDEFALFQGIPVYGRAAVKNTCPVPNFNIYFRFPRIDPNRTILYEYDQPRK
jgi:hypothetical protein